MIEILSIEDPKKPKKTAKKQKKRRLHKVKAFLADHFEKKLTYKLKLPFQKKDHPKHPAKTDHKPAAKHQSVTTQHITRQHPKPKAQNIPVTTTKSQLHPNASYTLNIDHSAPRKAKSLKNHAKPAVAAAPKPKSPPKLKPIKKAPAYNPVTERIWNILQLISTAAVLFALAFIVMNWSAYSVILEKRVNDFLGLTDTTTLEKLAADKQVEQTLLAGGTGDQASSLIPALSLDVTPPDTRILIPRINQNVPVIPVSPRNLIRRDWGALEKDIQEALRAGVVHYPGTALPGEDGNVVITGHSSYFPWDPGRFKDVFALLHDLQKDDRIVVYYNQQKYIYEVDSIKVILPEQVEVLDQKGGQRLTLLTCTPVGTNLKRLVIEAKPI